MPENEAYVLGRSGLPLNPRCEEVVMAYRTDGDEHPARIL